MATIRRDIAALVTGSRGRIVLAEMPGWMDDALCAQTDPDAFYAEGKGRMNVEAKKTCGLCPVRDQCLDYALDHEEWWGVWGGKSERERRKIARERREAS